MRLNNAQNAVPKAFKIKKEREQHFVINSKVRNSVLRFRLYNKRMGTPFFSMGLEIGYNSVPAFFYYIGNLGTAF